MNKQNQFNEEQATTSKHQGHSIFQDEERDEPDNDLTYFEMLPLDAIFEIFSRLPHEDVVKMRNESAHLNLAVRLHLKQSMIALRRSCAQAIIWLQNKLKNLPLAFDHLRLDVVKGILLVRYLSMEVEILFATVWRLRNDEPAWTELAPFLAPVISEFNQLVSRQMNLELQRPELTSYRMRNLLRNWNAFLTCIDNGLEDRLLGIASKKTPFEIRVIDLLMCAPSFNFQLALKRPVNRVAYYDVYGFFKTINLKPVGQVPQVYNSELNIDEKKRTLLTYLRETVERENISYLGDLAEKIYDLELGLRAMLYSDSNPILSRLKELYQLMQEPPYSTVMKDYKYQASKKLFEEYYIRTSHENLSFTGLNCILVVPQQEVSNLPLMLPYLRGQRQKLHDHFESFTLEGLIDRANLFSLFTRIPNCTEAVSDMKPRLQLIINYRESYVAAPSEIVIDVGYDEDNICYMTFHNLHGELLHQSVADPVSTH